MACRPLLAAGFSAVQGARLSRMGLAVQALRQIPGASHPGTGLIMEVPPLEWKTVPGQELFIQISIETGAKLKLNKTVMFV